MGTPARLSSEALLELVELLYATPLSAEGIQGFLRLLRRELDAVLVNLVLARGDDSVLAACDGWTEDQQRAYATHYSTVEPWRDLAIRAPVGVVLPAVSGVPVRVLERTEWYSDFLRPMEARDATCVLLARAPLPVALGIIFPKMADPELPEEAAFVQRLVPHLMRVLAIQRLVEGAQREVVESRFALDQLAAGVLVLDADGRVLRANAAAEALLGEGDGLRTEKGQLAASRPEDTRALRGALAQLGGGGTSEIVLRLERVRSSFPLMVVLQPAPAHDRGLFDDPRARALLFVSAPELHGEPSALQLAALFRLTPAEARLARLLTAGATLEEASQSLGVSIHTVRVQLKSIFAKTGTQRQAELVRLLITCRPPVQS